LARRQDKFLATLTGSKLKLSTSRARLQAETLRQNKSYRLKNFRSSINYLKLNIKKNYLE